MMTAKRPDQKASFSYDRACILVVEDEPDLASIIRLSLERHNMNVEWCDTGEEAIKRLASPGIDLVLLDVILPGIDGHAVCQKIRSQDATRDLPVIMVTSLTDEPDMIVGLGLGADDYVRKPFSCPELVARTKAALRRGRTSSFDDQGTDKLSIGELEVNHTRHACSIAGNLVPLTMAEYRLLHFLMTNAGKVFTRQDLLPHVVGEGVYVIDRNIDVHVRNLRRKIGPYAACVVTVRGVGYRFDVAQHRDS